jgi:hypothetical protein
MEGRIGFTWKNEYCNVGREECGLAETLKMNGQNNVSGVEAAAGASGFTEASASFV